MIYILIASAALALLIVTAGVIVIGRNALTFIRTAKKVQLRVEPMVFKIMHMVEVVQNRAFTVMERSQILQRRIALLSFVIQPLKIIIVAWQRATDPVNRFRSYVGL